MSELLAVTASNRVRRTARPALGTVLSILAVLVGSEAPQARAQEIEFRAIGAAGFGDELYCMAISHRDPNHVVVGTANGKIHRTIDGGATWQEIIVTPYRSLFFGRERDPDPRLEYALGLPGKSPHLQSWLRQKGLHTSGINLQQLLVLKGDKIVGLNWIEIDWHDEKRYFIGTTDGLYRSLDMGRTFARIWQGRAGARERMINTVVTDPAQRNRLLVGTSQGLYKSSDGGASFKLEMNFYVRKSYIRALFFSPVQRGLVHLAMAGAGMASPDSGENWITTHWHLWGPRSDVQWISLGPDNLRLIGTRDGVWYSNQGGEMGTWKRGGHRFVARPVGRVLATPDPRVWYATTDIAVWITRNAGESWHKMFQTGGYEQIRWLAAFRNDPKQMWLLTNRQIYRVGTPAGMKADPKAKRRPALLDLPALHEFWTRVMKNKHLHFDHTQGYRDRAPWGALLPSISASLTFTPTRDISLLRAYPFLHYPFSRHDRRFDDELALEIFAVWDLERLIFDRRELPHFGRVYRHLSFLRRDLTERVHRLYTEYRRIASDLAYRTPKRALAREFQRLRLQEIAAFFDAISDGYWSRNTGGV